MFWENEDILRILFKSLTKFARYAGKGTLTSKMRIVWQETKFDVF